MKYLPPKYELAICECEDILRASKDFEVNKDTENNKLEYIFSLEDIFGF